MTTETGLTYAPTNNHTLVCDVPLALITPSPLNPRKTFDADALAELATSISTHGLLEPIVVRAVAGATLAEGPYTIIAGERRYHAAKLAGLQTIPARIVEGVDDRKHLELALLENLQRQDLDPLEEAAGYQALRELGYTQTQIGAVVKRSQPAIAKSLALLDLPADVQERVRRGELSPTHGQVIASKYRDFPAVASAVAAAAVESRLTTQSLEERIPATYDLVRQGLVVELDSYGTKFDWKATCPTCPFGAYRKPTTFGSYCLRPAHFAELQNAAIAAEGQRMAAMVEKAQASGKGFPKIGDFAYDQRERIEAARVPAGCTGECPCRLPVEDGNGKIVEICTDVKRYKRLQVAATKERNKDARAEYRQQLDQLQARLEALTVIGPRELALLVAEALRGLQPALVREAAALYTPELAGLKLTTWDFRDKEFTRLTEVPALALVRLALDAMIRGQLHSHMEFASSLTPWYDWYVGDEASPASPEPPAPPPASLCYSCQQPIMGQVHFHNAQTWCPACATTVGPWAPRQRTKVEKLQAKLDASHDPVERTVLAERLVAAAIHEPHAPADDEDLDAAAP